MNLLLVEDDSYKREHIKFLLESYLGNVNIYLAASVNQAYRFLEEVSYEIVVLDMSLPNFSTELDPTGGIPVNYGGEDIIDYINKLGLKCKVIFISQYANFKEDTNEVGISEISLKIQLLYAENYLGFVYYNAASDLWKKDLIKFIDMGLKNHENLNR
jgi:CheY-like chemotaxis protein